MKLTDKIIMDTYEKKYKALVEAAKMLKEANPSDEGIQNWVNDNVPELKESENERMKRELIAHFRNNSVSEAWAGLNVKKVIAWLENLDEQKPFDYENTNIQQKDFAPNDEEMIETLRTEYEKGRADTIAEMQGEQKSVDKVEPKFKVGDWVVVSTAKGDKVVQIASVEYFKDGHPSYFTTEGRWFGNGTKARLLTDKDVETITLPESKIIVNQNPAWSEEDEVRFQSCLNILQAKGIMGVTETVNTKWLKSIKERYTWKPSDEQIRELGIVATGKGWFDKRPLREMYEQLKKLKGE